MEMVLPVVDRQSISQQKNFDLWPEKYRQISILPNCEIAPSAGQTILSACSSTPRTPCFNARVKNSLNDLY